MTPKDLMELANLALAHIERQENHEEMKRWYVISCELEALARHNPMATLQKAARYIKTNPPEREIDVEEHLDLGAELNMLLGDYAIARRLAANEEEGECPT